MPGIEEAAAAFDADMNRGSAPAAKGGKGPDMTEGPQERMFGNIGELEVDDESPERGGGDDIPLRGENRDLDDPPGDDEDEEEEKPKKGEDDEEGDEDDEEGDEEGDEDEEASGRKYKVVVDGEEEEVTLKEALEGYSRTKTFHQRMNDVEQAKTVIRETAANAVGFFEYSKALAEQMKQFMDGILPPEPNWDEEFKANPATARAKQKYYEDAKKFKKELDDKIAEGAKKVTEANQVQLAGFITEEKRKFNSMNAKQWTSDPQRKSRDLKSMQRTAKSLGFTDEELSQVYDSRMLQVLLKASRYDRMMASKPKPVRADKGGQPASKGNGSARVRAKGNRNTAAMKRLNKTGSIHDAAEVFTNMINSERGR